MFSASCQRCKCGFHSDCPIGQSDGPADSMNGFDSYIHCILMSLVLVLVSIDKEVKTLSKPGALINAYFEYVRLDVCWRTCWFVEKIVLWQTR